MGFFAVGWTGSLKGSAERKPPGTEDEPGGAGEGLQRPQRRRRTTAMLFGRGRHQQPQHQEHLPHGSLFHKRPAGPIAG
ncbi:hypothetical protein CN311_22655 [Mesorhizobium sanjuanii]|uniref:Uncharacterized protein n=1 Tax=Mesorhizobium sanjuanii TaxID=2037900 RepID=A0A2A6FAR9_9HYPH|nr:hypothetical protein CN311_22655 [Mesorhizobium sanjuanii]